MNQDNKCEILWNSLSLDAWRARESSIRRLPLLQSLDYAQSVGPLHKYQPRFGLIKIDGAEAGLCMVLEVKALRRWLQVLMLDRGPVWFNNVSMDAFLSEFNRQFPRRLGRKCRIIPEMEKADEIMTRHGFSKTGPGYETLWLDLTQDKETLRANLKKKWRQSLEKGEGSGINISWDKPETHLPWFLSVYEQDKAQKDYRGASVKTLAAMGSVFNSNKNLLIGRAMKGDICIAAVMLLCHGSSATYQAGWSGEMGRKTNAHHLLLWQALDVLKHKGIKDFDLGGISENEAMGVKKFKEGLGGDPVILPGLYT